MHREREGGREGGGISYTFSRLHISEMGCTVIQLKSSAKRVTKFSAYQPFTMARRIPVQSYTDMLVEANQTKTRWVIYNICAGISTWILLAAFLIIPGTFTSLRESSLFQSADQAENAAFLKEILHSIAHVGLLWVAGTFYVIGLSGCFSLWRVRSSNYIWLMDRLFL